MRLTVLLAEDKCRFGRGRSIGHEITAQSPSPGTARLAAWLVSLGSVPGGILPSNPQAQERSAVLFSQAR